MPIRKTHELPQDICPLDQLADHLSLKQEVPRSNRGWATIFASRYHFKYVHEID